LYYFVLLSENHSEKHRILKNAAKKNRIFWKNPVFEKRSEKRSKKHRIFWKNPVFENISLGR